jgi:LmbE family N-acetylglucosaminyl deacetylase
MAGSLNRRHFIKNTAGAGLLPLSTILSLRSTNKADRLHIVCVGGHPDDPESGCGGLLAKFALAGHHVTIIYLTRGEAGINGKSHEDAASIRTTEALNACAILGAKAIFAGEIDGNTVVNKESISKMQLLIDELKPSIVFTHWPIDSHPDHQAASLLTIQSLFRTKDKFELYFFEVCAGEQTITFNPTDYIDISATQELKRKAVYCHVSQDPPGIYNCGHTIMEEFRGRELGVSAAEAFIHLTGLKLGSNFRL